MRSSSRRIVAFAYHDVGVRCLKVLLAGGVDIALVVTHRDDPGENTWFGSVAALCRLEGIPCIMPEAGAPELPARIAQARPDLIFSFYYRHLLSQAVLELAPAFNMHGSLLPHYRGRAPVNWAVLHGASETGATLHEMTARPDAGPIVAQQAVPILPDDTAFEVFGKVVVAAEMVLVKALPALLAGHAPRLPNELIRGSYFGARRPEDGKIDWSLPAQQVYNLHRAVAPPYPGAFTDVAGRRCVIEHARLAKGALRSPAAPGLAVADGAILGICGDGRALAIHSLLADGRRIGPAELDALLTKRG